MSLFTMMKTILRSLGHGPVTHRYPYVPAKRTPATRGHLVIEIEKCIFCGLCRMHCPADAIEVSKPDRTWSVNRFRCINCGNCMDYCPKSCMHLDNAYLPPTTEPYTETFTGPEPVKQEENKPEPQ